RAFVHDNDLDVCSALSYLRSLLGRESASPIVWMPCGTDAYGLHAPLSPQSHAQTRRHHLTKRVPDRAHANHDDGAIAREIKLHCGIRIIERMQSVESEAFRTRGVLGAR